MNFAIILLQLSTQDPHVRYIASHINTVMVNELHP